MKCRICGEESKFSHSAKILNKYDIKYFLCGNCGFLQTEEPYWLNESYSSALSVSDTGVMERNNKLSKISIVLLKLLTNTKGKYLDYGGGYGIFCRLMRDKGLDYFWYDKYAENLLAKGFEGKLVNEHYSAVTSFENFEHFLEPLEEIEQILKITDFILFSTTLLPDEVPDPNQWWYYCLEHGQHISLYSRSTLVFIANKYDLKFYTNGTDLHIFTRKNIFSKIFLLEKIVVKLGLDKFFNMKSRIESDMHLMIENMKKIK